MKIRRRVTTWASGAVMTAGIAVLMVLAMLAPGVPVTQVDFNDGGVWVTSDADGLFGRINRPAGTHDAAFYPPGGAQASYSLDILQDGAAVVAWDKGAGKLFPVDVSRAITVGTQGLPMPAARRVGMGGGTLAILDSASGQVWAMRADPVRSMTGLTGLDDTSEPVASVAAADAPSPAADAGTGVDVGAALAVSRAGTVYAVSKTGRVAAVRPGGDGFADADYRDLGRTLDDAVATVVGDSLVILDRATGQLVLPDGETVELPDGSLALQAPGPPAAAVLVETESALLEVDLGDGRIRTLTEEATGPPTAPVRLDTCVYSAWAGAKGGFFLGCDGAPIGRGNIEDLDALVNPVFRVNRGAAVLNDITTGKVWDINEQRRVDDWSSVRPPPVPEPSKDRTERHEQTRRPLDRPPTAEDDELGARPGRTTLLYVLDNDSDPAGSILSISEVSAPSVPSAKVAISPDGQTVAITVTQASGPIQFTYKADDGRQSDEAAVTVMVRGLEENDPPQLRVNYEAPELKIAAGHRLALPVLADWRDFDGDPIALVGAQTDCGTVTARPDGFLDFQAPVDGGECQLTYRVSDGLSEPTTATLNVTVQARTNTTPIKPITQPDVARGQVGQPITVRPLENDLPGSDPTKPDAVLALAGEVGSPNNATVTTNLRSGVVVVTANRPGAYVLEYTVAFGNAPFVKDEIRVDVVAAPDSPAPPVAMPDKAVLHGQVATMVDVLANDFDPAGGLLVVQSAEADANTGLQVAVVDNRWVRVGALDAYSTADARLVRYSITNGLTGSVTGEITVSRLPDEASSVPVPADDLAVVRAGDSVTVAVLDNDTNPAGAPMSLAVNAAGAPGPGQLAVSAPGVADVGAAYVTGELVRYVAPESVGAPTSVTVEYVVQNAAGDSAVGKLKVALTPAPGPDLANRPPAPVPLEVRAVSGQAITIDIPTSGVDVDGDSVSLVGLATAPSLGRVVSFDATSMSYVAFPTSGGTDSFEYRVRDRYGALGTATIRVGVIPPGVPQPPVAVNDYITAAPGATVHVDVLANDVRTAGDAVQIEPLEQRNSDLPAATTLVSAAGPIDVAAPELTGKPVVIVYAISNGIGEPSVATVTVRSQADFNNPPVLYDAYPPLGSPTVSVTVPEQGFDPDGDVDDLEVTKVWHPGATVSGQEITLPADTLPYTVAYEVRDGGGATAVGLIHVPAPGSGAPYARPGKTIEIGRDASETIDINEYVMDPTGRGVRLTTTDMIWASPPLGLTAVNDGEHSIVVTGGNGYVGPAALTFEVTSGESLTDPEGRYAVVSIPVKVGTPPPVLHCPQAPITVIEGGPTQRIDVARVCHVWVDDPAALTDLTFSASWEEAADGLNLRGSGTRTLEVDADSGTKPGVEATLTIGTGEAKPSQLRVRVIPAAPLSIAPIAVDGVLAGSTATVDVASYIRSQLREPVISVVGAKQSEGLDAKVERSGTVVRITPDAQSHGQMTFAVTVTDVADTSRGDRQVTGQITLNVLGVPDAPSRPRLGAQVLSKSVELAWSAPANNGAPILEYEVTYQGGKQTCSGSPCRITGLVNGSTYTFAVRARNLVGWSQPSVASPPAVPDTVPGAVTAIVTSNPQDHTLDLAWAAPPNEGTAVREYQVLWSGGGAATTTTTHLTATGLDNNAVYTFTIIAVNAQGPGPSAEAQGQSAGAPQQPAAPSFESVNLAGSTTRAVSVSWPAVDPNGPGPTTYTLTRTGNGTVTVCANVTATSCDDDGIANDGTTYAYSVVAMNAAAAASPATHTSAASPAAQMEATATPEPITGLAVSPTGANGTATVSFNVGASHGASSTVSCTWNGNSCGTWSYPVGGQSGVSRTITGLPNGQAVTVALQTCNGSGGGLGAGSPCNSAVSGSVTTYGPITGLSISGSGSATTANFTVSVNPNGKAVTVHVTSSGGTNATFTTGVGAGSWSYSNNVGYSKTVTINVTVTDPDGARPQQTKSAQVTTPAPPPTVTVTKGGLCGPSQGTTCPGDDDGVCRSTCARITVTTAGFSGNVTCTFYNTDEGTSPVWVPRTMGPNATDNTLYWYTLSTGNWVEVTCGDVVSNRASWT